MELFMARHSGHTCHHGQATVWMWCRIDVDGGGAALAFDKAAVALCGNNLRSLDTYIFAGYTSWHSTCTCHLWVCFDF